MIEGLHVTVSGTEIAMLCRKWGEAKIAKKQSLIQFIAVAEQEQQFSRADDVKESVDNLQNEAEELEFIASHIEPNEQYRLDHDDLRRIGIIKGYR